LRPLAEQGNALAQLGLGVMYAKGQGVPQDYSQAVVWYRKAAEQGDADAQTLVGLMYTTFDAIVSTLSFGSVGTRTRPTSRPEIHLARPHRRQSPAPPAWAGGGLLSGHPATGRGDAGRDERARESGRPAQLPHRVLKRAHHPIL
jgi:hypothetical protein